MTVRELNNKPGSEARELLSRCCGSSLWLDEMIKHFPFTSQRDLLYKAEEIWLGPCKEKDWLEAFTHHPKIGDAKSLQERFASTKDWASAEQASVQNAEAGTIAELANGNTKYEDKFGFIFIVCATGKTAQEMVQLLKKRLSNTYKKELTIAMKEQGKITVLRLQKLLS